MKRMSVWCIVLTLAVSFVPATWAATQCVHFTNFCDTLQVQTANGAGGTFVYGGWDWLCVGDYSTVISGIARGGHVVLGSGSSTYQHSFDLSTSSKLFNLYATDGTSEIVSQTNQPWTVTSGACRAGRDAKVRMTK